MKSNLFNKDFNILIIGQVISIIINSILNFSLGLYILDITKSSEIFGVVTAISILPWIVCAPLGGSLCDKYNQKNIMVILDLLGGLFIGTLTIFAFNSSSIITGVIALKIALAGLRAAYSPAVLSALIYIVDKEDLTRANSIVSQVNALATIIAPIIAGILYSFISIEYILLLSCVVFFFSAIIEMFIKLNKDSSQALKSRESTNITAAIKYMLSDKPLFKFIAFSSVINSIISSIIVVGLPIIIDLFLNLPSEYYGFASGCVGVGSFLAGFILYKFSGKITYRSSGIIYLISSIFISTVGFVLLIENIYIAFILLSASFLLLNLFISITYILRNSHLQSTTPSYLLAKVMALTMILGGLFEPTGQAVYGYLFGIGNNLIPIVLIISGVITIGFSLLLMIFQKQKG